jgi:holin-like protein
MGVCFVPAGVGIINHLDLIKQHGLAIVAITFSTTFILLTVVGLHYQRYEIRNASSLKP